MVPAALMPLSYRLWPSEVTSLFSSTFWRLAIISILYITVSGKLWLHKMPSDDEVHVYQREREIPKKKLIRMLINVVVVFALCWLPVHAYQMDHSVKMGTSWPPSFIYFCCWFSQANSAINPWLYIGLNGKMKAAFTKMIGSHRTSNLNRKILWSLPREAKRTSQRAPSKIPNCKYQFGRCNKQEIVF